MGWVSLKLLSEESFQGEKKAKERAHKDDFKGGKKSDKLRRYKY